METKDELDAKTKNKSPTLTMFRDLFVISAIFIFCSLSFLIFILFAKYDQELIQKVFRYIEYSIVFIPLAIALIYVIFGNFGSKK